MGLKVWVLVLLSSLFVILLVGLLAGFIRLLDFSLLVSSLLIFFAAYLTITRRDTFMKVPTPLELEKIKRKTKTGDNNTPGKILK